MENGLILANIDAEQSVLGAIFLEPEMYQECYLKPKYFYELRHEIIFGAMGELVEKGIPISLIAVAEQLGGRIELIGGLSYLSEIAQGMPTTASFMHYQKIITQHYERRQQKALLERMTQETLEGEPSEVRNTLRAALEQIDDLDNANDDLDNAHISKVMVRVNDRMQEVRGEITGAPTGFRDLDKMTSGFQRGDLVIIGARPSMGKTAFAINIAQNYTTDSNGVAGVFSLEMKDVDVAERMVAKQGNIDGMSIKNPQENFDLTDWQKAMVAMAEISETKSYLWDEAGVTISFIRRKCNQLVKRYPDEHVVVIIDYLQLIVGDAKHKGNRTAEISEISRELKRIARELDITVVALSQLSRGLEQRQDKRPMLSDLRESGQIEQDADVIIFLYRDDYYDKESESKNMIEIIIAKQRKGPVGLVTLAFKKEYSKFINIDWTQNQAS